MANRIKMATENAILVLRERGWSFRRIARELGIHRETVGRYVRLAAEQAKPARVTAGTGQADGPKPAKVPPGNAVEQSRCVPFRDVIVAKLELGLSAQRIWQDLVAENGFTASYSSVKRYVRRLGQGVPLPFRRMECEPGQEGQIDLGRGAAVVTDGKRRRFPHVFRIVLSCSRKAYSESVWRQTTESFIRCLENAFRHFGGVPRTLVIDNLRAAVTRADWYDPELNPKVEAFCRHYGTVILPTKPYTPRHKGKIERGIGYVKSNALRGHRFASLAEQNRHLLDWETQVADHRIHGTTREQVAGRFERIERKALLPLPATPFPFFHEGQRSVHRDAHVEVDKAYYSVPPEYVTRKVWVRWDARLVRVFNHRFEQIAVHVKREPGRFSTDPAHISPKKISSIERGAAWLLRRAALIGPETERWAQAMLRARGIQGLRVLQGLQALAGRYPCHAIEEACRSALSQGLFRLRPLRGFIQNHAAQNQLPLLETHPLIRPMADYSHLVDDWLGADRAANAQGEDEFIAWRATSGNGKEKGLTDTQALPAVWPPVSALRLLSSRAVPSGPAQQTLLDGPVAVNMMEDPTDA